MTDANYNHLLKRALYLRIRDNKRKNGKRPVWALVSELEQVGSTTASHICEALHLDPDKPFPTDE